MKFTHNGTEYDVADLVRELRTMGTSNAFVGLVPGERLLAAAALIVRHEAVCGALRSLLYAVDQSTERLLAVRDDACTALRGEEAKRG